MNSGMFSLIRTVFLVAIATVMVAQGAAAQDRSGIKPLSQTATLAEAQKWLVDVVGKYASYKNRVASVTISDAKFDGCTFKFTLTRKSGSISTATMGTTRTTNAVKENLALDTSRIEPDGIAVTDHVYPELEIIEVRLGHTAGAEQAAITGPVNIFELVVKRDAADAIKTALYQVARLCQPPN